MTFVILLSRCYFDIMNGVLFESASSEPKSQVKKNH